MRNLILKIGFTASLLSAHLDFSYTYHLRGYVGSPEPLTKRGRLFERPMDTVEVTKYEFKSWCPLVERRPKTKQI